MEATNMTDYADPTTITIADTCLLAALERRRISTTRADKRTAERIQREEQDSSITLNRHMFKAGPVRELIRLMDAAYAEHKKLTAPWVDKGLRILPGERFEQYAAAMNTHEARVELARRPVIADWDALVDADVVSRGTGADRAQYPTQEQAARTFGISWRVQPVPTDSDFRVRVPEYVKQRQREYLDHAAERVRAELLGELLNTLRSAAEKLAVPIGEAGSVFRDSLINNIRDAVERAKTLNVSNDPDIADAAATVEALLASSGQLDSLRQQQQHRENVASKLSQLAGQFASL